MRWIWGPTGGACSARRDTCSRISIPMFGLNHSYPMTSAAAMALSEWAEAEIRRRGPSHPDQALSPSVASIRQYTEVRAGIEAQQEVLAYPASSLVPPSNAVPLSGGHRQLHGPRSDSMSATAALAPAARLAWSACRVSPCSYSSRGATHPRLRTASAARTRRGAGDHRCSTPA